MYSPRRTMAGFVLPALGVFAAAFSVAADESARPNIVLIVADDLGYGDLGCRGAEDLRTPNLDRLFASGMEFTRFYANCPVCSPTRAALLTGCNPPRVGVPGVIRTYPDANWGYLDPQRRLLPDLLRKAGYHTGLVGKWHLGLEPPNIPTRRGFDEFHGFLGDMMDDYYKHRRHGVNYMRRQEEEIDPPGHATDLFTQWARDFIGRAAQQDKPFFLYLAYNAPHTPIQPPEDWVAQVRQREPEMTPQRAKLVALIEHLDHGVGEVLQTLEESGAANETLVIFTSDNGGQLSVGANNGPLRGGKQDMYEGGLRVPTCVVWPDKIKPDSETAAIGASVDVLPTLLDIVGVDSPEDVDGISLQSVLRGEASKTPPRILFFHRREGNARYAGLTTNAIRFGDWKLVHNSPFGPLELFNLEQDPREEHDLSGKRRSELNRLRAGLMRELQRGGRVPWQSPSSR